MASEFKTEKKEVTPESFQTRRDRVKHLKLPDSTQFSIIVAPNYDGLGFKLNQYPEKGISGITKWRFLETIIRSNKICMKHWQKKKREESENHHSKLTLALIFAVVISAISFLILILIIYWEADESLLYLSLFLLIFATIVVLLIVIKAIIMFPEFIQLEETIIKALSGYLISENLQFYQGKGWEWKMEKDFFWLELRQLNLDKSDSYNHIDLSLQQNQQQNPLLEQSIQE